MSRKGKKWTEEEINFLRENYKTLQDKQIGKELGRTPQAVNAKRFNMGLMKGINSTRGKKIKNKNNLLPDKAYLLGYLYGDGYTRECTVSYSGGREELEFIEDIFYDVYGLRGKFYKLGPPSEINGNEVKRNRDCYKLEIGSKEAVEDVSKFGPTKSKKWGVPDEIRSALQEVQKNFINGLFDSDGTVNKRGGKGRKSVVVSIYQHKNREGIDGLATLLDNGFDINSSIYTRCDNMVGLVIGKQYEVERFQREIGFRYSEKKMRLKDLLDARGFNYHARIEKYKKIKEGVNDGETIAGLARKYDVSPTAIRGWLGRLQRERSPPRFIKRFEGVI